MSLTYCLWVLGIRIVGTHSYLIIIVVNQAYLIAHTRFGSLNKVPKKGLALPYCTSTSHS